MLVSFTCRCSMATPQCHTNAEANHCLHSVPYWNLTQSVERLSFHFSCGSIFAKHSRGLPEQKEASCAAYELPAELPSSPAARDELNSAVVSRTVITAGRTGRLRRLCFDGGQTPAPFAIRTLLPLWVNAEWIQLRGVERADEWTLAATSLRPLLAHASLWLAEGTSANSDRLLTLQDVQGLQSSFKAAGTLMHSYRWGPPTELYSQAVNRYLPWLAEDAKLAEQVCDAWNAVVERGEVGCAECQCDKCGKLVGWEWRTS